MRSWGSQHLSHVHLLQAQAFDECGTRVLGGAGMHCGVESCCGRVFGVGWFAHCCFATLRCDDRLVLAGWNAGVSPAEVLAWLGVVGTDLCPRSV